MDFSKILYERQSCRAYDVSRQVENEKLEAVLEAARLSPSACNGQPYHITVCIGEKTREAAKTSQSMGMNKFASDAPIVIVISEEDYVKTAAIGAKLKKNDYRSIDIGICAANIVSAATEQGLSTCILGWFDDDKIRGVCGIDKPVRLLICLGYAKPDDKLREKKRKGTSELITYIN